MKLEKFKERNNKQKYIIIFTIACVLLITGVFLYKTFASFQVIENEDLINGNVSDPGDVYFAFYVDGVLSKEVPQKGSNYVFNSKKSYCGELGKKNDNIIPWYHREDGSITVEGMLNTHTKCVLYFERGENFIETIQEVPIKEEDSGESGLYKVSHTDAEITYTEEKEKQDLLKKEELRYAGSDPDNYVWFNHELWRIIGLVNTPEGQRIKLIRNDSIGNYSWDSSLSDVFDGKGIAKWDEADLMTLLNDYYYNNKVNQICYNGQNNQSVLCSFDGKDGHVRGLKQVDEMIDTITWNVGGVDSYDISTYEWYNKERNNFASLQFSFNNTWYGKIALKYTSDFGYATTGTKENTRTDCLSAIMSVNNHDNYIANCSSNNYLAKGWNWSLVINIWNAALGSIDFIYGSELHYANITYPALYLKPDILVSQNSTGTIENPYLIS